MAERETRCAPAQLREAARDLLSQGPARLATVVATDDQDREGAFTVRYVFSRDKEGGFATLRAGVPVPEPRYPSLAPMLPAAQLFEREVWEFFGVLPQGHPDLRRLILHEDWPEGIHPLRAAFPAGERPPRRPGKPFEFLRVQGEGVFEIPVGPVHAGIIEPGHFRFSVAGEPVIHLEARLGYVHKGVEKLAEALDLAQGVRLAERISGDAAFSHALAYCQAVENLGETPLPARAGLLRVIFAELERLHAHLADIAGIATDVGFVFGAMHALRLRELVLRRDAALCGDRFLKGVCVPGGVRRDLSVDEARELWAFLRELGGSFQELRSLLLETDSLMDRLEGTGILSQKTAADLGGVGPAVRASGLGLDLRRDQPYAGYGGLRVQVAVQEEGDVAARFAVKLAEFEESLALTRRAIDSLPGGDICAQLREPPAGREAMGWAESPRGEVLHWLRAGPGGRIARLKVKDPSFVNWPLLPYAVRGNIVPDFPLINKSFNLSYSGNDR